MTDDDKTDFGPEWEEQARETLKDVEFDTELGIEMAKDSERLAQGEITEAEFNEKYREQVIDEFGMDARPTIEAGPDRDPTPADIKKAMEDSNNDFEKTPLAQTEIEEEDEPLPNEWISLEPPEAFKDEESRRSFLKKSGIAAGALSIATFAERNPGGLWGGSDPSGNGAGTAEAQTHNPEKQMGMVIDTEACVGDLECVRGCKNENQSPQGALWQFVFQYQEPEHLQENSEGENDPQFLVRPCQHCSDPPCVSVCPVRARHKRDKDGIVLTDYDICIGCRYCQVGCPYGVNYFQWGVPDEESQDDTWYAGLSRQEWSKSQGGYEGDRERTVAGPPPQKGVMTKCTFCVHRQESGDPELMGTTGCEQACPQNAIRFGDLTDPESDPNQYLKQKLDEQGDIAVEGPPDNSDTLPAEDRERLSTFHFKEERGTSPNVIYIGNEPSAKAKWTEDYIERMNRYEDLGERFSKVRDGHPWKEEA